MATVETVERTPEQEAELRKQFNVAYAEFQGKIKIAEATLAKAREDYGKLLEPFLGLHVEVDGTIFRVEKRAKSGTVYLRNAVNKDVQKVLALMGK